jgi:hypothetical protein
MKSELINKYGSKSAGDKPEFVAKARLLQSWYRLNILGQKEYGFGPEEKSSTKYGNILVEGNKSGLNFLDPEIFEYAKFRLQFLKNGETIREYRLYNNMLSSQPMCFNLFYPIKSLFEQNEKAATKILKACFPNLNIKTILAIEIEFLPYPTHIYLDDKTAFDAMIVYQTESDEKNILAIETKYVEKLGDNPSSKLAKQIDLVKNSPIFSDAGKKASEKGFGQLGRNFLLAEKYKIENRLDKAYAVTISPTENDSSKAEITEFYEMMDPKYHNRLFYKSLEEIVDCIKETSPKNMHNWINDFQKRYLGFGEIENLFKDYKKA